MEMKSDALGNKYYLGDCVRGAELHLPDNSVDLIVTDPPFGIEGEKLEKHYARNEANVISGYTDVDVLGYPEFTRGWVKQAERVLKPGGSMYVVSGYTNLHHVLNALHETSLKEVNHIIWKYNFGVWTTRKYVTSHYHVLFWEKPGERRTFNTECRHPLKLRNRSGNPNYRDREDVWDIKREYRRGVPKNVNQLPSALVRKMIQYSSNEGDLVADFFMGSFTTAHMATKLGRRCVGFEISPNLYEYGTKSLGL